MSEQEKILRIEGVVRASSYGGGDQGKQFLGAVVECSDGTNWVIDYDEQSPFHAFADRRVDVSGESYEPEGQRLIGREGKRVGHFRVSLMRLVAETPDARLVEVRAGQHLTGQFERETRDIGESTLSFVTESGNTFLVVNDPAGASIGRRVEVWAYPVQPPPSLSRLSAQYRWIICPCSAADLWEWRARR